MLNPTSHIRIVQPFYFRKAYVIHSVDLGCRCESDPDSFERLRNAFSIKLET